VTALSALRPDNLRARIDDGINPIVVKELRQAVQSRFVVAALLSLLSTQLIAIGVYLVANPNTVIDIDAGRQVFMLLYGILLFLCMLFVPLYTAVRLVAERSDTNVDLLFITTIKPRSIIAGKLFSAIIITILIFSACMPFMAFTYFLRGIDLPSIFIVLALGFIIVMACTQLSIFVAAIPVNRVFKLLFGIFVLWFIFLTFLSAMAAVNGMFRMGIGSRFGDWEFWETVFGILSLFGLVMGSFFVLSVALITPQAANRALPVRLFITSAWGLLFVAALIANLFEKDLGPIVFWQLVFNSIFAIALFAGLSERDRLGRRVLRSVPQSTLKRALAFFFFSGAASGVIWASAGICLTLATAWAWSKLFPNYDNHNDLIDSLKWAAAMCLYLFCYALSGAWLRRHLLSKVGSEVTWLIGVILMILGIIVPILTGYLLFSDDDWLNTGYKKWLVGNPFAWGKEPNEMLYLGVPAVWAFIVAALNLRWFIARVKDFRNPAASK
jgi:hypothetical protein